VSKQFIQDHFGDTEGQDMAASLSSLSLSIGNMKLGFLERLSHPLGVNSDNYQRVVVNKVKFSWRSALSGVPEGSILAQIQFYHRKIVCPKKSKETGEGPRAQGLLGLAEGTGIVYSGEKEVQGRLYCSLQLPKRRLQ